MHGWYPDLDQLRRQAKKLLRQTRAGDPQALRLFPRHDRPPQLADAQYAVAKAVGFASWAVLVRAVASVTAEAPRDEERTRLILVRGGQGDAGVTFYEHGGPGLDEVGGV